MSFKPSHQSSIIITPATLKEQIIIRINTLVGRVGGSYYGVDDYGSPKALTTIEGVDVYGLVTRGRDVFLELGSETDSSNFGEFTAYNANDFYLEQLWDVYMACEPIYQHKFLDYATSTQE